MSQGTRPVFPILNVQGRQANFGVVSRTRTVDFVDYPQRTAHISPVVIPVNTSGTAYQMTVQQVQSNSVILFATGGSGSASSTFILPSAQQLIQAFQGVQVGHTIRLNVVNKGPVDASIFSSPGNGQVVGIGTGGPTGIVSVLPYLQGISVAPLGLTVLASAITGSAQQTVGSGGGTITVGKRAIDIEFVSISPNPQASGSQDQFVSINSTGSSCCLLNTSSVKLQINYI